MKTRVAGANWQIAGAALLTAWVLAACGLNREGAPTTSNSAAVTGITTTDVQRTASAIERRGAARIESGQITRIERLASATTQRQVDGPALYRIVVRLQDGRSREFTESSVGELKVGDKVQVVRSAQQPTT